MTACSKCGLAGLCTRSQGDPGVSPYSLTSKELLTLACALARVGSVVCDLGQVGSAVPRGKSEEPYIWELKE